MHFQQFEVLKCTIVYEGACSQILHNLSVFETCTAYHSNTNYLVPVLGVCPPPPPPPHEKSLATGIERDILFVPFAPSIHNYRKTIQSPIKATRSLAYLSTRLMPTLSLGLSLGGGGDVVPQGLKTEEGLSDSPMTI